MEIEFKMWKCVIFTARGCFRSICDHPFLAGFLCLLIFLYRLSPLMFSLLVSVSPIFISTAILLGTLLSYGQPNVPEIEIGDKVSPETASVMIVERSLEVDLKNVETMETGECSTMNDESLSDDEVVENHYVLIPVNEEHLDLDDESSEPDSSDSKRADVNLPSYPSLSSWVKVEGGDEEEEAGDYSDSGSDLAESSSPNTSIAEINSVIHELHPLLDIEIENSEDSEVGEDDDEEDERGDEEEEPKIHELHPLLDDEIENNEDSEVGEDDDEEDERGDEEEEPEIHELHPLLDDEIENNEESEVGEDDDEEDERGDEEEEPKPVVTWTEEDHKNVMDLGNSEIERNVRLENLMLRMRARKNMRIMMEEMKLIDLESCDLDLPFNVPPIRTTRSNLYDLSHDFPDSAPSILLPRRNPFDIPHDEEPSFVGGRLQEFVAFRSKGHFFRGQGRFNARPSFFAPDRQDNEEVTEEYFEEANEVISETEHISVGHGSQSSEEESVEDDVINRDVEFDKLEYSRVSSSSSLSEASERVYVEPTNPTVTNEVIQGVQFTEPVYDLSPTAVRNNTSSSITSDVHVEPDQVSTEGTNHEMENEISIMEMLAESSVVHPLEEQEYGPIDFSNTREHEDINSDFLGAGVTLHVPIPAESFVGNIMDSDLDHVTLLSADNYPLCPGYVSMPLIASGSSNPHVDQIIVERTDENEIRDSDEEVLSELDSIMDFSIKQWDIISSPYEEDIDLVAGSSFPAHDAQTRNLNIAEFHSVGIKNTIRSGSSNEENDMHDEVPHNTCITKHEYTSNLSSEKNNSDSPNPIAPDDNNYENNDRYTRNMKVSSMEDASLNYERVDIVMENNTLAGSGDHHIPRVLDPAKELLALEPMPLGSTNLLQQQVFDENAQKELMQDSTYGPLKVEAHLVASSMEKETSVEASRVLAAAKLCNEDIASEGLNATTTSKGEGKFSKSSAAGFSCGSESSSSDSDRE